jgi:ABC-2 type transport system ATP-binding protein
VTADVDPRSFGPRSSGPPSAFPPRPILVLDRVHARDAAAPGGKTRGRLDNLSVALPAGVHAILGSPEDGTIALAEVIGGAKKPTRGSLRVLGRDPHRFAAVRARIGVLGAEPRLPPVAKVADAVRVALRARGEAPAGIDALLDPLGLSPLHARRIRSLSLGEARAIELALALSTPAPVLIALFEPMADVSLSNAGVVRQRVRELATAGACVVVITSSPADARALADRVLVLHRGAIARELAADGTGADFSGPAQLVVWMRADAGGAASLRAVAAAVVAAPGVHGVGWDTAPVDAGSPSADQPDVGVLRVHAADAEAAARALTDAAIDADVHVDAIAPATPSLAHVRAATDAMLRAMAMRRVPPPAPPPPPALALPPPSAPMGPPLPYAPPLPPPEGM